MDLGVLLSAEQQRLSRRVADERQQFFAASLPGAREMLARELEAIPSAPGPTLRRAMMSTAQGAARRILDPWFGEQQRSAERLFRESMTRFVQLANEFLERLANSGLPELDDLRGGLEMTAGLAGTKSTFVFNEVITVARPASPLRFGADMVLGVFSRRPFERSAMTFLDWLLEMNSSRVQSDVDDRIAIARRALETEIRSKLQDVEVRAKRALAHANETRAAGEAAIQLELLRFQETGRAIAELLDAAVTEAASVV